MKPKKRYMQVSLMILIGSLVLDTLIFGHWYTNTETDNLVLADAIDIVPRIDEANREPSSDNVMHYVEYVSESIWKY